MTENLSQRLDSFKLPTLNALREIWRYRPLAPSPQRLSSYSGDEEETILHKMGVGVHYDVERIASLTLRDFRTIDLDDLADVLEKRGTEFLVTNVFGEQRQNLLTSLVGLPYREFTGVMLRGIHNVGEVAEPVCALVTWIPNANGRKNGRNKFKVQAGWGGGAKRLETEQVFLSPLLKQRVSAEMELGNGDLNIRELGQYFGFRGDAEVQAAITPLIEFGSKALQALQIEYNQAFSRQLRRRGSIVALTTVAAIAALFLHEPRQITQLDLLRTPTPPPPPTEPLSIPEVAKATAVATTDWRVMRQQLLEQDEDLLRSGSITETGYFDNNLISSAQIEVGGNSRRAWFAELVKIKADLPPTLQNLPLGILQAVREHEGDIPTVVMETTDGKKYPVFDIPSLAIQILEWTWQGDSEDQKVRERIVGDILRAWKLEGMRDLVSISRDVYNSLVVTLPLEPSGRTITVGEAPVSYSWGPERNISPVLGLPNIMSNPLIDPQRPSAVVRIDNQYGSLYCLVPQEYSRWALDIFATHDRRDLPMSLEFVGPNSRFQDLNTGQITNFAGFARLSIPSAETVTVQGQEVATTAHIPCLPIFVPR